MGASRLELPGIVRAVDGTYAKCRLYVHNGFVNAAAFYDVSIRAAQVQETWSIIRLWPESSH
jgi:hypothetical protein